MDRIDLHRAVDAAWTELERQAARRMAWVSRENEQIDGHIDMHELVRKILETVEKTYENRS